MDDHLKSKEDLIAEVERLRRRVEVLEAGAEAGVMAKSFPDAELVLGAILQGTEEAIFVKDLETRYKLVNSVFCRDQGLSVQDLLGKTDTEIFGPDDGRIFAETDLLVLESDDIKSFEGSIETPAGRRFWLCSKMPFRDRSGRVVGILGFNRDITNLRQAQRSLENRTRDLEDFIENAMEGIHWIGLDGTILRANRTELELLGYERDQYVGRHISEFHADDEAVQSLLAHVEMGEDLVNFSARLRARDGSVKHVLINSSMASRDGRFLHARCFTRDVTERVRMESELRDIQAQLFHAGRLTAVGELGAGIAHELHQPLTAIQMLVETMQVDESRPISAIREECELISDQIFRMVDIIDGMRDLARKKPLILEPVPAMWSMTRVLALLREQMRLAGVELVRDMPMSPVLWIQADKNQLQQVFLNLLTNSLHAFDAAQDDKRIRVAMRADEDHVVFEVVDNGPGIPETIASKIFNPFFTTKDENGTGLGLSLSRSIVREHRGDLSFESSRDGTVFFVKIPRVEAPCTEPALGAELGAADSVP